MEIGKQTPIQQVMSKVTVEPESWLWDRHSFWSGGLFCSAAVSTVTYLSVEAFRLSCLCGKSWTMPSIWEMREMPIWHSHNGCRGKKKKERKKERKRKLAGSWTKFFWAVLWSQRRSNKHSVQKHILCSVKHTVKQTFPPKNIKWVLFKDSVKRGTEITTFLSFLMGETQIPPEECSCCMHHCLIVIYEDHISCWLFLWAESVKVCKVCPIWMLCEFCGPQARAPGIISSRDSISKNVKIEFFRDIFKHILNSFDVRNSRTQIELCVFSSPGKKHFICAFLALRSHQVQLWECMWKCLGKYSVLHTFISNISSIAIIIITNRSLWRPSWMLCLQWKLNPIRFTRIEMKMKLFLWEGPGLRDLLPNT